MLAPVTAALPVSSRWATSGAPSNRSLTLVTMAGETHHGEALKIHISSLVASIVTSLYNHSNLNLTLTMLDLIALFKYFFCSSPMTTPNKLERLSLAEANICYCGQSLPEWSITPLGQTPGLTRKY
jgi:hypothetical protein